MFSEMNEYYESAKKGMYGNNSKEQRKQNGQFFTPPELGARMLEKYDCTLEEFKNKTILDNCCGSGMLLAYALIAGADPKKVFGIELDPEILKIARRELGKFGVPEHNIHLGNALNKWCYVFPESELAERFSGLVYSFDTDKDEKGKVNLSLSSAGDYPNYTGQTMKFDYIIANPPFRRKNADAINKMCIATAKKAVILNTKLSFGKLANKFEIEYAGLFGADADQRVYIGVSGGKSKLEKLYEPQECDPENPPPVERSVLCTAYIQSTSSYLHEGQSVEALWNRENIAPKKLGNGYSYILFDTEKQKSDFIAELEKSVNPDKFLYYAFGGWYEAA